MDLYQFLARMFRRTSPESPLANQRAIDSHVEKNARTYAALFNLHHLTGSRSVVEKQAGRSNARTALAEPEPTFECHATWACERRIVAGLGPTRAALIDPLRPFSTVPQLWRLSAYTRRSQNNGYVQYAKQ